MMKHGSTKMCDHIYFFVCVVGTRKFKQKQKGNNNNNNINNNNTIMIGFVVGVRFLVYIYDGSLFFFFGSLYMLRPFLSLLLHHDYYMMMIIVDIEGRRSDAELTLGKRFDCIFVA